MDVHSCVNFFRKKCKIITFKHSVLTNQYLTVFICCCFVLLFFFLFVCFFVVVVFLFLLLFFFCVDDSHTPKNEGDFFYRK